MRSLSVGTIGFVPYLCIAAAGISYLLLLSCSSDTKQRGERTWTTEEIRQATRLVFPSDMDPFYRFAADMFPIADDTFYLKIEGEREDIDRFLSSNGFPPFEDVNKYLPPAVFGEKPDIDWWAVDELSAYKVSEHNVRGYYYSAVAGNDPNGKYVLYVVIGEM